MDGLLFFGWGAPIAGREHAAVQVFGEILEAFGRMAAEGRISSCEPVLLNDHGGGLGGFFLVRGEEHALAELALADDFERLVARAGLVAQDVGIIRGAVGERLQQLMAMWAEQAADLAPSAAHA